MLVDNLYQQSYFSSGSSPSYPEYSTELSDIFDTELFNNTFAIGSSINASTPSGSRGSSPQTLLTPPQDPLPTSFPEIHDEENTNSFYSLFDDDLKTIDTLALPSTSTDFMGLSGMDAAYGGGGVSNYDISMNGYGMAMDLSTMGVNMGLMDDTMQVGSIDPQLVDTPSAVSDHGEDDSDDKESPKSPVVETKEPEKPTITIAPVKVGGHGKARKGTVQSGGVVKKTPTATANKEKENTNNFSVTTVKKTTQTQVKATTPSTPGSIFNKASTPAPFLTGGNSTKADSEAGDPDDEDDLPQAWRPSPEVFAKMTSKEKRQLRNKISARNFRVRRKEYISTLEGDIAERDRMLDHFRTQLGSQESENLALRQEIAALKKALLEGRGGTVNLPPPAPLPEHSAAEMLAASAASTSTHSPSPPLLTANTQKDLPSSPRMGNRFWGGVGVGGGFTPVHTTLVPDVATVVRRGLQENMNPALNGTPGLSGVGAGLGATKGLSGFDGFADLNPFTMKTLDAYRMHLWGKMAAQQHAQQHQHMQQQQQQHQQPAGLASNMRPHFFTPSSKPNMPSASSYSPGYGSTLSALLSGKHTSPSSSYPSPPASPLLTPKGLSSSKERETQQRREKEQQHAMLAAMASQTIIGKLGSAFWDAFTGGSSSHSASTSTNWDADKVQRVLSGKAVLRVVDVEPATPPTSPKLRAAAPSRTPAQQPQKDDSRNCCGITDILEESMRSLTLGKKM